MMRTPALRSLALRVPLVRSVLPRVSPTLWQHSPHSSTRARLTALRSNTISTVSSARAVLRHTSGHVTKFSTRANGPTVIDNVEQITHKDGVLGLYEELVRDRDITDDPDQRFVLQKLQTLYFQLLDYRPPPPPPLPSSSSASPSSSPLKSGFFSSLFGGSSKAQSKSSSYVSTIDPRNAEKFPKGLYLCGSPGSGKTFLMDLFFSVVPVYPKKRVHFNKFMLEVHEKIHKFRTENSASADPIPPLAHELRKEALLICFDEFQVLDIASAMTIRRLFSYLWDMGVVVVATSNRPPDDLYLNGLQRDLFLPFIGQLKDRCVTINIDSEVDYRQLGTKLKDIYFTGSDAQLHMDAAFQKVTGGKIPEVRVINVMQGRTLTAPQSIRGVARFTYDELCNRPLAAADYLAICENFHTVFVDNIPVLRSDQRNEIRRLILLVDELYQHKLRLVCSASAPPEQLLDTSGGTSHDEVFAFSRLVSRLNEMQSKEYLDHLKLQKKGPSSLHSYDLGAGEQTSTKDEALLHA